MCRNSGEIVLLSASRLGVVYLATVKHKGRRAMDGDDVRLLTIQSVTDGTLVFCTFPAPMTILHSVFAESVTFDDPHTVSYTHLRAHET